VPNGDDQNVYIVLDDFDRLGSSYRETDPERADLETTITDLMTGQFNSPVRVVAFNTAERWAEDASEVSHGDHAGGGERTDVRSPIQTELFVCRLRG
jgi:hypothetical protein